MALRGLLLALLLLFPCSFLLAGLTTVYGAEPMMQISMSDWTSLRSELTAQKADFELLQTKSEMLRLNSIELQRQLGTLRTQLTAAQNSMEKSEKSLIEVQSDLTASRASLNELRETIKQEQHKRAVVERQRDAYAIAAVVALGWAASRR